jgi:hypothetical protein
MGNTPDGQSVTSGGTSAWRVFAVAPHTRDTDPGHWRKVLWTGIINHFASKLQSLVNPWVNSWVNA